MALGRGCQQLADLLGRAGLEVHIVSDESQQHLFFVSGFSNLSLEDLVSVVYYERVIHGGLDPEKAAHEEEMLLALVADDVDFETGSPEEIGELLAASAEGHGIDLAAGE